MASFYADEQFPFPVVELLRTLGHDVLTVQDAGNADRGIPDDEVLAFAINQERSILTIGKMLRTPEDVSDSGRHICATDAGDES